MIIHFALAGLMLASPPVGRIATPEQRVMAAASDFFAALRSDDKTALAATMTEDAVIFVHDRTNPNNTSRVIVVPLADHLAGWEASSGDVDEYMFYENVQVDGGMAHIWGPYSFWVDGEITHCGINSLSLERINDVWLVGNTSFTMAPPSECEELGAPDGPVASAPLP